MLKLLSCVLSATLIITSVTPSLAQIRSSQRERGIYVQPTESTRVNFTNQLERRMAVEDNTATAVNQAQAEALKEIQAIVLVSHTAQDNGVAQEPLDLKTLFPIEEFVRLYKQSNQSILKNALAQCENDEQRAYVQNQWNTLTSQTALTPAYNEALTRLQQEIDQEDQNAKAHLRYLSEQAVELPADHFKYNGEMVARIDPVAQFLPLMAPLGSEVLTAQVRTKANNILRARLQAVAGKACEDESGCERLVRNAAALAVLGNKQADVDAVAKAFEDNYNGPAASAVISVLGPMLLAMNDIDPQYRSFEQMMGHIIKKADKINYWDIVGGTLSLQAWVEGTHANSGGGVFAKGYENSFYQKDNKYKNSYNAWIDFGRVLAQESAQQGPLKTTLNHLVNTQLVALRKTGNRFEAGTTHNLLLTGLLAGGYQLDIKGQYAQTYLDAQGRAHQTQDTRAQVANFNEQLQAANLTQSEWLALSLYRLGKTDIEPYTSLYIQNQLTAAYKRAGRTAASVGMSQRSRPSAEELSSYNNWRTAQGVAGALDVALTVVFSVMLVEQILVALPRVAASGAQSARNIVRATRISRAAKAANVSRLDSVQRVLRTARYYKYGTYSRGSVFLQNARTSLGATLGYRVNMADLLPKKAPYVPPTTTVTPAGSPARTMVLDGNLTMVPAGHRYVRVGTGAQSRFVLVKDNATAAQIAREAGVPAETVVEATDGMLSGARTTIAPQNFASTGAPVANVHKVQPLMAQTVETGTAATTATTAAQTATAARPLPRWIEVETQNALGNTVKTWKPNPAHPDYQQIMAELANKSTGTRKFSRWENLRLAWELNRPDFAQLFRFGTSRYGVASLTMGVSPLSSEAAIARAAETPAIVQTIQAERAAFISEDALRGGAGASARLGAMNQGAMTAQSAAAQTARTVTAATRAATQASRAPVTASSWLNRFGKYVGLGKTAAVAGAARPTVDNGNTTQAASVMLSQSVAPTTLDNFLEELDRRGYTVNQQDKMAAVYLVPPFWRNWRFFQSTVQAANRQAAQTLSQQYPLATALVQIVQSPADVRNKKVALLKLYHRGKLTGVLRTLQQSNPQAYAQLMSYDAEQNWEKFAATLYDLYRLGIITNAIDGLTDNEVQNSLLAELNYLVQDKDFQTQASVLYHNEALVPSSHQTFQGDVPTVPEANQKTIAQTFRRIGEITTPTGVDKGDYTHYEGDIPFYYRSSDGKISNQPVGVLSQQKAGWYNTMLSHIPFWFTKDKRTGKRRLKFAADRPGFDIPKGFVLALDEQGQWKLVMPVGNRAMIESIPASRRLLQTIQTKGSVRVEMDTPYTSTDLLAMAHMLEHHPDLRLQLLLNAPSSLKPWLTFFGSYIGLDAAASLTGPFKEGVKSIESIPTAGLSNGVSGAGYLSPWIGGIAMKLMTKIGYVPSILGLSAISFAGLIYALYGLGLDGRAVEDFKTMGTGELLTALAMPMGLLVITASLFGALVPVILNIFKDPIMRTSANLDFSTTKQYSRLYLTLASFFLAFKPLMNLVGVTPMDWTIVVPVALGLLLFSTALFVNTPMFNNWWAQMRGKEVEQEQAEPKRVATAEEKARFEKEYNENFLELPGVQAMKSRVRGVYWAYAASLMMIGQLSSALLTMTPSPEWAWLLGDEKTNFGQLLVATFMFATAQMRSIANVQVKNKVRTDDQFTGMSIPLLAITSALLAVLPYSISWAGALAAVVALLHYVGTAVPGQLDSTRIQNMVSAQMQQAKQEVLDNDELTEAEKKERIAVLELQEKDWASRASATYSYANGFGLWGVLGAAGLAAFFRDWAPEALLSFLDTVATISGHAGELPVFTMDRLVFAISTVLLARLTIKNWGMTKDFLRSWVKQTVSQENIDAGKITPATFGVTSENAEAQLASATKELGKMKDQFAVYGVVSETKMTDLYNSMAKLHNQLTAIAKVLGMTPAVKAAFEKLMGYSRSFRVIIRNNGLSEMLQREFEHMAQMMSVDGELTEVLAQPQFVEQGLYTVPPAHPKYEDAKHLINEMDLIAHHIVTGQSVSADMYGLFMEYYNRVLEELQEYRRANVADSKRVGQLLERLNNICLQLRREDEQHQVLSVNKGPTSNEDVQALRDMLNGIPVSQLQTPPLQDPGSAAQELDFEPAYL